MSGGSGKIRVLVVDDSAMVRKIVTDALSKDPEIEVVGTAVDPYIARDKILQLNPDVMTLDIEMPRMDGLTFLKIVMEHRPMPVIIMSSLSQAGSQVALDALKAGAVEVLGKPSGSFSVGDLVNILPDKIKLAAHSKIRYATPTTAARMETQTIATAPKVITTPIPTVAVNYHPRQVIVLGASTGGTEALKEVLIRLPKNLPGICIVQHIPAYFSKAFADRLNTLSELEVREAQDGDRLEPGLALVAPGGFHMEMRWMLDHYKVYLNQGPMVCHQRPAVDNLFESAAKAAGRYAVSALFTGMGKDGAQGMLKLKEVGARTFAQDEATCVVFGMPRAAMELGATEKMVPLLEMPKVLVDAAHALARGKA